MPLGFGLLTVFGVARALRLLLQLLTGQPLAAAGGTPAVPAETPR